MELTPGGSLGVVPVNVNGGVLNGRSVLGKGCIVAPDSSGDFANPAGNID